MGDDNDIDLSHQDIHEALSHMQEGIHRIRRSGVYSRMEQGMFDLEDIAKMLRVLQARLVVDAHEKGELLWK